MNNVHGLTSTTIPVTKPSGYVPFSGEGRAPGYAPLNGVAAGRKYTLQVAPGNAVFMLTRGHPSEVQRNCANILWDALNQRLHKLENKANNHFSAAAFCGFVALEYCAKITDAVSSILGKSKTTASVAGDVGTLSLKIREQVQFTPKAIIEKLNSHPQLWLTLADVIGQICRENLLSPSGQDCIKNETIAEKKGDKIAKKLLKKLDTLNSFDRTDPQFDANTRPISHLVTR